MCGIFFTLGACTGEKVDEKVSHIINSKLLRRGPDCYLQISECKCDKVLEIGASVLHLRGENAQTQPLRDCHGNILLWNGEIFDGIQVFDGANDGLVLLNELQNCNDTDEILLKFASIQGPWAAVYWQEKSQKLWFGRDFFGRRSLIWKLPIDRKDHFIVTSVATLTTAASASYKWTEITTGIYCIELNKCNEHFIIDKYPWKLNSGHQIQSDNQTTEQEYCQVITSATKSAPSPVNHPLNLSEPTVEDLTGYYPLLHAVDIDNLDRELFSHLCDTDAFRREIATFTSILGEAVRKRVQNLPRLCKKCQVVSNVQRCEHAKVAVLFSGGLDSTVLCALADRFIPQEDPIDLFNVAFQQCQTNADRSKNFQVPDRKSGFEAMEELSTINPNRKWNFVEVNVTKDEVDKECEKHIWDLVHPLDTVLDGDIGSSLWFAARGEGIVSRVGGIERFKSHAKVVLTGMGADEQFGGYSRHKVRFVKEGWKGLVQEMKMDMDRISVRNLGRDDRVISDHGREARFPYLDENVVSYLNRLPIWLKVNLALPRGIGDKILLRLVAYNMGLRKTARLAKRAIQFGSRISKLETGRKGSDRIDKLVIKCLSSE